MKTFEQRIKHIRGKRTMKEFADLIGATQQKISNYESGKVRPNYEVLSNISMAGYNLDWLLTGNGEIYVYERDVGKEELIEENTNLKRELEAVKKMAAIEAFEYIKTQLEIDGSNKRIKKPK